MPEIEVPQTALGAGRLGPEWSAAREDVTLRMSVAYGAVSNGRAENFALWQATRQYVTRLLKERFRANGLTGPPFVLDALWARVELPAPAKDANEHIRLVRALLTDSTERLGEQVRYRLAHEGNVHLDFRGPTGMGKSSCALALADWISPIPEDRIADYLSFDLGELPQKLKNKRPGETALQDEYLAGAGEGARTFQSMFANLEDTLRASQVNLFVCSPRQKDHGTMQAHLEILAWNPERKYSLFLVWIEDHPHGVVALPWCPERLYAAYRKWKDANVERSLSGQFKDNTYVARTAMRVFEDARFVDFLLTGVNKPKKSDFENALTFFHPQMMSGAQADRVVAFMTAACYGFRHMETRFLEWFGVEPNAGFRRVADKCGKG
ncbi:MAG TPA: hypothetical protein VI997_11585 [Candidatus Thermoplasmatota archaeon]|nr:hypothetical protein [Candidatus Thermoplasmatota archaeon]